VELTGEVFSKITALHKVQDCWHKKARRWLVSIKTSRIKYIGQFTSEEEAALAYNKAALEAWGEDAYLNKVGC